MVVASVVVVVAIPGKCKEKILVVVNKEGVSAGCLRKVVRSTISKFMGDDFLTNFN